jgi:hypothetical protein
MPQHNCPFDAAVPEPVEGQGRRLATGDWRLHYSVEYID